MQPWKCPECGVWNAPGVKTHRCDNDGDMASPGVWTGPYPTAPSVMWWGVIPPDTTYITSPLGRVEIASR